MASRQERKEEVEMGSQARAETSLALGEPRSAWFQFVTPEHSLPCSPAATWPHSLAANSSGLKTELKP